MFSNIANNILPSNVPADNALLARESLSVIRVLPCV